MSVRFFNILKRKSIWYWLVVCVVASELLTFFISFFVSFLLWGRMSRQVLIIGIVDSFIVSLIIVSVLLFFMGTIKKLHDKLERQNEKLSKAISEIKTLQGILPICSFCKQIRNDKGYYEQIDHYVRKHSDVDFSHTVCPDCAKKYYPGVDLDNQ